MGGTAPFRAPSAPAKKHRFPCFYEVAIRPQRRGFIAAAGIAVAAPAVARATALRCDPPAALCRRCTSQGAVQRAVGKGLPRQSADGGRLPPPSVWTCTFVCVMAVDTALRRLRRQGTLFRARGPASNGKPPWIPFFAGARGCDNTKRSTLRTRNRQGLRSGGPYHKAPPPTNAPEPRTF